MRTLLLAIGLALMSTVAYADCDIIHKSRALSARISRPIPTLAEPLPVHHVARPGVERSIVTKRTFWLFRNFRL